MTNSDVAGLDKKWHQYTRQFSHGVRAFDPYVTKSVDFVDAYNAATMERRGLGQIYSYDADFDKLEGIARQEP